MKYKFLKKLYMLVTTKLEITVNHGNMLIQFSSVTVIYSYEEVSEKEQR